MTTSPDEKPVGYFLVRTARVVKLAFHQAFKEMDINITPEQWVILERLHIENDQSQKELASESFKNAPTISRIIDVLCKKGWTERITDDKDRRLIHVHLTTTGSKIVEKIADRAEVIRKQGWKNLSKEDYNTFVRIMNQVFDNYDTP